MKLATVLALSVSLAREALGTPSPSDDGTPLATPVEFMTSLPAKAAIYNITDMNNGYTQIVCNLYDPVDDKQLEESRKSNIEYFSHTTKPKKPVAPGECERIGCYDHVAVRWCNGTKKLKAPDSWKEVADALKAIPKIADEKCSRNDYDAHSFKLFHKDGWSLTISKVFRGENKCR
ncbi:hypothetical protein ACCO45_001080 [Purpureocillium lilacinum]|uniref:Uncharacterized protein n=1 Tax=Purpureocillium lilacinum TaxID=33203 RepID=A0ACC4E8V6_PURLI